MRTVRVTLDEDLFAAVDRGANRLGTSRSAFARQALMDALDRLREDELERQHREGYARQPVQPGEFDIR